MFKSKYILNVRLLT